MGIEGLRFKADLSGLPRLQAQVRGLPKKLRKKTIKEATMAAGNVVLKEVRRTVPRVTGFLKRSLTMVTMPRLNFTSCKIGQRKQVKRKLKATTKSMLASNINRSGYAAPIHLVENSTKPHVIKPKNAKMLRFMGITGTTKGGKIRRTGVFRRSVKHPGTSADGFLRRSSITTRTPSKAAFLSVLENGIRNCVQAGGN
jgi:hypothetical protein